MKKVFVTIIASGLVASVASAGTSVTVDFASAYVFRGTTAVDDLVMQPGIEVDGFGLKEECGSIALGVWGSSAPFEDDYNNLHETDWYAVYTLPEIVTNVSLSVGFTEYQYAFGAGEQEINLVGSLAVASNLVVGGSANFMIDNEIDDTKDQIYVDFFADLALDVSEDFDVSVGGLVSVMFQGDGNSSDGLDDGFNHFELYGDVSFALNEMWGIGASLAYIGQLDDNVLTDDAHDRGLVAMFSIGCDM